MNQIPQHRGAILLSPRGDGVQIELLANTPIGITYKHPTLGVCSRRYDSMTAEEHARLTTAL